MEDLSDVITLCRTELHRIGESWRSPRTLDFCEKMTGKRDAHYLAGEQLQQLLAKLQALPTATKEIKPGAKVRQGIVHEWDEDISCWIVKTGEGLEPFDTEELELVS